ncbi:MAG: hypothetical protein AAF705_10325 [Bacteroidota bacterium]
MDLKKFKLQLINQIMQTDDLELLQTIQQILRLNKSQELIQEQQLNPFENKSLPKQEKLDEAAQELQDSIDEVFNP